MLFTTKDIKHFYLGSSCNERCGLWILVLHLIWDVLEQLALSFKIAFELLQIL